tara:strand:- start:166 stop:342 length:177 start_codon:yes stop_codon:yes gene_type:complete
MKDQYLKLADNANKLAIGYDNKESEAMRMKEYAKAADFRECAARHRLDSSRYTDAANS